MEKFVSLEGVEERGDIGVRGEGEEMPGIRSEVMPAAAEGIPPSGGEMAAAERWRGGGEQFGERDGVGRQRGGREFDAPECAVGVECGMPGARGEGDGAAGGVDALGEAGNRGIP